MIKILKTDHEKKLAFELRKKVFVVEQNVPLNLEIDNYDFLNSTVHLGYFEKDKLIGVARIIDLDKETIRIGRVAVDKQYRSLGIGKKLLLECEEVIKELLQKNFNIILSAQLQVENFYKTLGYIRINDTIYLDAGIEHIDMRKSISC
ncbi:GNAT family N-acetyltransferase [Gemella cuniculi]|uniref:GNAT family N-acetyltransferase n=1 Tax=Gemella cuniculi TaxID=150240 RepID=UPI00040D66F6|nr:GNAT family N-acetyltransferase [Gemella cuniculi]